MDVNATHCTGTLKSDATIFVNKPVQRRWEKHIMFAQAQPEGTQSTQQQVCVDCEGERADQRDTPTA